MVSAVELLMKAVGRTAPTPRVEGAVDKAEPKAPAPPPPFLEALTHDTEEAILSTRYYLKRLKDMASICPHCEQVMDRFDAIEKALSDIEARMAEEDEADEGDGGLRGEGTEGR